MLLTAPVPFKEAIDAHQIKTVLSTSGSSAQLRQFDSAIKRRSQFSAYTDIASVLQKYQDVQDKMLAGELDRASARLAIKDVLAESGYMPDPEVAGGIQDLSSDRRINLKLDTDVSEARGYGWREQGMQADVLDEFPAQELYRAFAPKDAKAERDWAERWAKVGGQFYDGRMIALKTDPIWEKLGSSDIFPDGLDNPYPPFAFNSGMDVRDIGRDEAEQLGLLDADTQLEPQPIDLNADLAATPDVRDGWLKQALTDTGLGTFDDKGTFNFKDEGGG